MTQAPPLEDGEHILFDHIPSLRAFRRTALVLLGLTLPVVVVFLVVFPDTLWPVVPLFVTCVILMQERVRLGRYRAWVTNRRIVLQAGEDLLLSDITAVKPATNGVKIEAEGTTGKGFKLVYPEDRAALVAALQDAKETA